MASNTKGVKGAKEFIDILMVAVLLFIITMLKTPFLVALSIAFFRAQNGMRMTSRGLA